MTDTQPLAIETWWAVTKFNDTAHVRVILDSLPMAKGYTGGGKAAIGRIVKVAIVDAEQLERLVEEHQAWWQHLHHTHERFREGHPQDDRCAKCGLDLRDSIHTRVDGSSPKALATFAAWREGNG